MATPRHAPKKPEKDDRPEGRRHRRPFYVVGAALVLAGIAAGAIAIVPGTIVPTPAGAATHGPLRVASITPNGHDVAAGTQIEVRFNNPLASNSPLPSITPRVAGTWAQLSASVLVFQPRSPMLPGSTFHVTVPAATRATDGTELHRAVTQEFMVQPGSMLRLNQVLAELGYLPLRFVPTGPYDAASSAVQRGVFAWRFSKVPTELTSLWAPNSWNLITEGALMRFEDNRGLSTVEAPPTPGLWRVLLRAVARGQVDRSTYDYVVVSQAVPETLTLYVNMRPIYSTLVNTGIYGRPTAVSTNPVYLRFTVTTMSGTNPDGSHYDDPGIPWVSYFNGGEALHGYIRATYGWPQSLGCVEMPFAHAQVVWPYTPIGTLVTVT